MARKATPNEVQNIIDGLLAGISSVKPIPIAVSPPILLKKGAFDEEEFVLFLSDLQAGHKTRTFNFKVLQERMERLVQAVEKIAALHRKAHPVKTLNVFILGDLIQSERIGFMVSLDELEAELRKQLFDAAIPVLQGALARLARVFSRVNVYCVRGNHGSNGKFAATNTNWDDVAYRFLELSFRGTKHMHFSIADNFYQMVKVLNTTFLLVHGDNIKCYMGFPWYGADRMIGRWKGSIGHFDAVAMGHFHTFANLDLNAAELYANGTFVSDDTWVLKVMGLSGSCSQILLGVHPRIGVSFVRKLRLG